MKPIRVFWPILKPGLLLVLTLLAFGLLLHPLGDPDVYIHLRDGQYWVQHHLQVDKEPFAYTIPMVKLERVETLFRISIYAGYQLGGYSLLTITKALAMCLVLWLLAWRCYRRWSHLGVSIGLVGIAMLTPMNRILPERPFVITYLCMLWIQNLLDHWHASPQTSHPFSRFSLWWIPLLVIPWANIHPGFVILFVFIGALFLEHLQDYWQQPSLAKRQQLFFLGLISLLAFLAGAVNLVGFNIYSFVAETTSSKDFMKYIIEWAPPAWPQEAPFFICLTLVWVLQIWAFRAAALRDFLPMAVFSYLALKSYRNIPLFLMAALPPAATQLRYLWRHYFPAALLSDHIKRLGLLLGILGGVGLITLSTLTGWAFRLGELPDMYPKSALAWLLDHPLKGRLLTHDIWGGYTGWTTNGRVQIFIDGRFPSFGEHLYSDYRKMIWGQPECLALLDHYQIQGILVSPKNDMNLFYNLWRSRQWALVYWDDVSLLYLRRELANEALIQAFEYRALDPKKKPFFNPNYPELALLEAERAAEITPNSVIAHFLLPSSICRKKNYPAPNPSMPRFADWPPGM